MRIIRFCFADSIRLTSVGNAAAMGHEAARAYRFYARSTLL